MAKTFTTGGRTITLSNLGPLTTAFTPPAGCLPSRSVFDSAYDPGADHRTACYPGGFATEPFERGYYSPGVCPVSYEQATTLAAWWLESDETGYYCCPSGFHIAGSTAITEFASCSSSLATPMYKEFVLGSETQRGTYPTLWATPIPIIWREQDGLAPTAPTNTGAISTARDSSSSNTTTIVIATIIPIALIAAFVIALILHRRRIARPSPDSIVMTIPELDGMEFWSATVELPAATTLELPGDRAPLPGQQNVGLAAYPVHHGVRRVVPSPVGPAEDDEIAWLRRERERVNQRRDRLLEVQALEDEDRQLERSIRERTRAAGGGAV